MASTGSRSITAQNWALNYIWTYNDNQWNTGNGGWAGHTSSNGYYLAVMQLTTPSWTGIVQSITFTICAKKNTGNSPTIRWALSSSMDNRNNYKNTMGSVSDGYQLASGTVTMSGIGSSYGYYSFTANTPTLRPNTTYYLFLWAYTSNNNVGINKASSHSFYVNYSAVTTPTLSASSGDMGSAITISTKNAAAPSMTHTLQYRLANEVTETIAVGVGATDTMWTVPDCASIIPNATSTPIAVICTTYGSDGAQLGSVSITFIATVPANVIPSIDTVSITDVTEGIAARYQAFIQSKSRVAVYIAASGASGSTITKIETVFKGKNYNGASWTAEDVLTESGTAEFVTTVTDSRGRTASRTTNIEVIAYTPPQITAFSAYRTTSPEGPIVADNNGAYAAIQYVYSVPSLNGGNTATMTVAAKLATSSNFDTVLVSGYDLSADTTSRPATALSADYRWDIQMTVVDAFGAFSVATIQLPTAAVILDVAANGKGLGIGKTAEGDGLDIAWPVYMRDDTLLRAFMLRLYPVGCYYWSSDSTDPSILFGGTWTLTGNSDFVIEQSFRYIEDQWDYRKWASGRYEAWMRTATAVIGLSDGSNGNIFWKRQYLPGPADMTIEGAFVRLYTNSINFENGALDDSSGDAKRNVISVAAGVSNNAPTAGRYMYVYGTVTGASPQAVYCWKRVG